MLLVVFGAGASFDCLTEPVANHAWLPPLTKDVFNLGRSNYARIAGRYKGSAGIIDEVASGLRANADGTLERELAAIQERATTYDELKVGLSAARFYLSRLLMDCSREMLAERGGLTNYTRLVRRLEGWRAAQDEQTTYVTFNYDTLLDEAIREFAPLQQFSDFILPHRAYFKVHGSVDWARRVEFEGSRPPATTRQ